MERVSYEIEIAAPREKVFDLIARVEDFTKYSHLIREIKKLDTARYRWRMEVFWVPLEWEAEVVEYKRPEKFAWRSTRGVYNAGSYTLKQDGEKTRVKFEMYYSIPIKVIEKLASPILTRMIKNIYAEVLENVKRELEGEPPNDIP